VDGAPVTIRVTDFGLVLQSEDLEALDAIEDLIMQNLDASTGSEEFALFYIKHRDAVEAKEMLQKYLGIGGGSGGGGGALGGLMGGMLRNTVGEGAGSLVDTFMGGSSSGSDAGVFVTRGPVAIVADVQKYTLMVSALPEDMTLIERLVNLIDQPDAIQQPNSIGDTYTIDILYRDPTEIADMVRESLGDMLKGGDGQGGEQGNAQGRAEQQFIQALMGQRGGGGSEQEELPKATLAVDQKNDKLVVTGPRFIYERVLAYVVKVDQPNNRPMQAFEMIEVQGRMDPHLLTELAQLLSEDNIEIIIDEDDGSDSSPQTGSSGQNNNRGGQNASAQQMQNLARLQQAMQQRARQQQQQQGGRGGGQGGRGQGQGGRGGGGGGDNPRGGGR
ncbi:MAG: hypothetical protein ACR2NP_03345, partial [Pirellulaceae bacterium]